MLNRLNEQGFAKKELDNISRDELSADDLPDHRPVYSTLPEADGMNGWSAPVCQHVRALMFSAEMSPPSSFAQPLSSRPRFDLARNPFSFAFRTKDRHLTTESSTYESDRRLEWRFFECLPSNLLLAPSPQFPQLVSPAKDPKNG